MSKNYLSPRMDLVFKMIFGNEKNVDILAAFLKSVLSIPEEEYSELRIVDPNLKSYDIEDKAGILDVKILTKSGNSIDVEIQVANIPKMRERIVFYTSKMITEQVTKGENYDKIKRVISIVITDYKLITENNEYHNVYKLYDKNTGSEFTDVIEINTLELPKLPQESDSSLLWDWLKFLKSNKEEEMEMIAEKNPDVKKAVCVLAELSQDERTRLLIESREKARRDIEMRMIGSREEGIKEGEIRGEAKGKVQSVVKMVMNLNIEIKEAMKIIELDEKYYDDVKDKLQEKE